MNIKKLSKLFYINGTNGGNKGILPERGKDDIRVDISDFRLDLSSDLSRIVEFSWNK